MERATEAVSEQYSVGVPMTLLCRGNGAEFLCPSNLHEAATRCLSPTMHGNRAKYSAAVWQGHLDASPVLFCHLLSILLWYPTVLSAVHKQLSTGTQ